MVALLWFAPALAGECDTCGSCHTNFGTYHHQTFFPTYGCVACHPMHGQQDRCASCASCHGDLTAIHGDFDHTAAPGSASVIIFPDNAHDSAAWAGERPYFAVEVDCAVCHASDLPAVHGGYCATCHPTPYSTLGVWNRGCQQGGCHSAYHEDSATAHLPFENPGTTGNDCTLCHDGGMGVPASKCLNCHATYGAGDVTPPVTSSTGGQGTYVGPAKIAFSITEEGKVGVGRTFYRLNGGPVTATGRHAYIAAAGSYTLEFWSKDQAGNTEAPPKSLSFTVQPDTTPPVTTANAQPSYFHTGVITLTATDNGTLGVKKTYYRLDAGPTQTGTTVSIPTTGGTHALGFWSEDWTGNIEAEKTVTFAVNTGNGLLRLVWGGSDTAGSPCPGDPEANAAWTIRAGSSSGPVVASGYDGCPGWSGVNDVALPVSATSYHVVVEWWSTWNGYDDQTVFPNATVSAPGEVVRLAY